MWWKLGGLALIEAILIWLATKPVPTHAVVYDLNEGLPPPGFPWWWQVMAYGITLAVVLVPILAYGIYRRATRPLVKM